MTKDEVYLKHILDAISDTEQFISGLSQEGFFRDREKQYAVLRALEVIGEATKNLSSELKTKYPGVDWRKNRWNAGQVNSRIFCGRSTFGLGYRTNRYS